MIPNENQALQGSAAKHEYRRSRKNYLLLESSLRAAVAGASMAHGEL